MSAWKEAVNRQSSYWRDPAQPAAEPQSAAASQFAAVRPQATPVQTATSKPQPTLKAAPNSPIWGPMKNETLMAGLDDHVNAIVARQARPKPPGTPTWAPPITVPPRSARFPQYGNRQ